MKTSHLTVVSAMAGATVLVASAFGWHPSPPDLTLSPRDQSFIIQAEAADTRERAIAIVVEDKSADPQIRRFAGMEAEYHSSAVHQLGSFLRKFGMREPVAIVQAHVTGVGDIEGFCQRPLDNRFLKLAVQNHSDEIELLSRTAAYAGNPDVRQYARNALQQVQAELVKAQQLQLR